MPTVNEDLFDRGVRHQVFLTRLSTGVANRMVALMNRVDEDIVRQMREMDPTTVTGRFQQRRLDRMLERLREINDETRKQLKAAQAGELTDLAAHEIDFQKRLVRQIASEAVSVSFDSPSAADIRAAALSRPFQGTHLRWATQGEHVDETFRRRFKQVRDEIRKGFVEGDSIDQIVRRIRGTAAAKFQDGILEISRRDAHTIARTAVNHTANRAREIFYDENSRLIKGVRWVAILDGRTSAVCKARDGKIFPLEGRGSVPGVPADLQGRPPSARPPAHPNCRSTTIAVLKSFRDIGIDADDAPGMRGDVPEAVSYNVWLRKQPRSFVEETLGKTKAKLYLDGDLDLDRFIDRKGQELTVEELRAKEMGAFERAGL